MDEVVTGTAEKMRAAPRGPLPGAPAEALAMVATPVLLRGYAHGLRQPCVMFDLAPGRELAATTLQAADVVVRSQLSAEAAEPERYADPRIGCAEQWTSAILRGHGHPVLDEAVAIEHAVEGRVSWRVMQPCLDFEACIAAMEASLEILNGLTDVNAGNAALVSELVGQALKPRTTQLRTGALGGFNSVHFLRAAHEMGVPWLRLSANAIQVGTGCASRLLESSFTDRTSIISSNMARNKLRAAAVLRDGGIPVPPHSQADSAEHAAALAEQLGYPVVVKPADLDGGVGVAAYLQDAAAVREAFKRAAAHSKTVLVEKHFEGKDYRIQVVNGIVQGVLERSPGSVVGDGRHSIRQLVERQNFERQHATDDRRYLHAIVLDGEAEAILAAAGMSPATVPEAGRLIRLRGASNVATGGVPRAMPLDEVHPDNLALALRAARLLRLDVAGIDLLIRDIRHSWLVSGAAICEVNAQPQMFTTMHGPMLRSLLNGTDGRIPVVIVLSPGQGERCSAMLHDALCATMPAAGLVNADAVKLGCQPLFRMHPGSFMAARALMMDKELQALVVSVSDRQIFAHGWPVDRCDAVVLAGAGPGQSAGADFDRLCKLVTHLQPEAAFADGSDPACAAAATDPEWRSSRIITASGSQLDSCAAVADAVVGWLERRR